MRPNAQACQAAQAEGWMPQRVEHEEIAAGQLDDSAVAHVIDALAAVPHFRLDIGAVVQQPHAPRHRQRFAVQTIDLAADHQRHLALDARRGALPDFLGSIQTDDALGRALPQQLAPGPWCRRRPSRRRRCRRYPRGRRGVCRRAAPARRPTPRPAAARRTARAHCHNSSARRSAHSSAHAPDRRR